MQSAKNCNLVLTNINNSKEAYMQSKHPYIRKHPCKERRKLSKSWQNYLRETHDQCTKNS
jgi:hypothetical protein